MKRCNFKLHGSTRRYYKKILEALLSLSQNRDTLHAPVSLNPCNQLMASCSNIFYKGISQQINKGRQRSMAKKGNPERPQNPPYPSWLERRTTSLHFSFCIHPSQQPLSAISPHILIITGDKPKRKKTFLWVATLWFERRRQHEKSNKKNPSPPEAHPFASPSINMPKAMIKKEKKA